MLYQHLWYGMEEVGDGSSALLPCLGHFSEIHFFFPAKLDGCRLLLQPEV